MINIIGSVSSIFGFIISVALLFRSLRIRKILRVYTMNTSFKNDGEKYLGQLYSYHYWLDKDINENHYENIKNSISSICKSLDTNYSDFGFSLNISAKKLLNTVKKNKSQQHINASLYNLIKKLKKEITNAKIR